MYLLHKKSVLDCYDYIDSKFHENETMQIFNKIEKMHNYYCFVLVLDEQWKYGNLYKVLDYSTHYSNLHDIPYWFLDENHKGIDFMIDDGNLLMVSYYAKIGGISYIKRTVAIRALKVDGTDYIQIPIDHEFINIS
ncbi:MAG: hypothetical protein LUG46_05405 [Erysipelotrichaceae bacterium]|nr:hypothetical protein [Erysipelotrichaceae bacterium]